MSFSVVTVKFSNDKSCFVSLSKSATSKGDIQVFEIESYDSDVGNCFVSGSGDVARNSDSTDGILQISGLFGEKLGLKENNQVILRPYGPVPKCSSVNVEPVSTDDWEIFDRNSSFIESRLLDQLRVIQPGKVYPIWVEKSVCVFIKIGSMKPAAVCSLLVNETEVLVKPKVSSSAFGQPAIEEPIGNKHSQNLNAPLINYSSPSTDEDPFDTRFNSTDSDKSFKDFPDSGKVMERKAREKSPYDHISNISGHWKSLFSYFMPGLRTNYENAKVSVSDEDDFYYDEEDSIDSTEISLQNGLNLVLRVQCLKYNPKESDLSEVETSESFSRRGSHSPRKSGSSSPRKGSRESPPKSRNLSNPRSRFRINYFPQQPSTVYMDMSDLEKQLRLNRSDIPHMFFAKLRKLSSPKDQQSEKLNVSSGKGSSSPRKESRGMDKDKSPGSVDSSSSSDFHDQLRKDYENACVVRVVVFDRRRQICNDYFTCVIKRIMSEQPLLKGHVIIPDMLRRYLKLDVTSRVWLQTWKGIPAYPSGFSLYPLGNIPKLLTGDKVNIAFRTWLEQVSSEEYPLVAYQGLFVRFEVLPNEFIDAQLLYSELEIHKALYTLLHPGVLRHTSLNVVSGGRGSDHTPAAIHPMLAYTSISSIDPNVPNTTLQMIGGMQELIEEALLNIEICLGSRPLNKEVFLTTPGLLNGMLLLTGPKGSGKTTLARALCRQAAEMPNMAYTTTVECKPLRGKKVDTIQKIFELIFDEAAWRQPALILLEDLDHVAGSPAGPEFEMSGEALYAARVAEVVKDLLRKDIRNMSCVAVLATSQSRGSLNPILTSSRGTHLVQEVLSIQPPDKNQRKEIIQKIMQNKPTISETTIGSLDLDQLAQRTQGYVARDLENVINRAVHAHILAQGRAIQLDMDMLLTQDDFYRAIEGFTPASIRNVSLHQAGELGWEDVGGLTDVKETLIETLQWPVKYPTLFANCPLRLRSGLLLYGAPGTGKTLLAGVVARECGLNFISIKGPELLSKYIGASEQAVRDTFIRAQSAKPCILFFDEFDSIAPRRGHDNTGVTDRVVNQLLTQLDGVEGLDGVYVLAATSRPDLIDPALLRPGRLDKSLLCKLPNEEERLNILKALSRKMQLGDDIDFEYFAKNCEDFTGADFKALLYNAQLEAIHEITAQDNSDGEVGRFGMKSRKGRITKLKRPLKTKLSTDIKSERRKSFSAGTFAYIPSLEKGVVQISMEMEEKLTSQVNQIRLRERRHSEHIPADDRPESPYGVSKMIMVYMKHLVAAAEKMRPSVSGEERLKYQRIYENFVQSRGGNFDMGFLEGQTMKATLA